MDGGIDLQPSPFEEIIANTLARLERTGLFTGEELASLREAGATGSLSRAKEIEAILDRSTREGPR